MDFWAVANLIWVHGSALFFQYQQLSALAATLPIELQRIHRRSTSLSFSLRYLGEVLRGKRFRVLDTDHNNYQDILQMVEEVTTTLFGIIYGIRNLTKIPESGLWDTMRTYFGFSSSLDDWKMQMEHLMSETNEMSFALAHINHVVTASNAKKAVEICDRLERLEESVQQQTSVITKLFRSRTRGVRSINPIDHLTTAEMSTRARAYVLDLCKTNETYRWYKYGRAWDNMFRYPPFLLTLNRFLDDTTVVILVGDVANVNNILAFAIWFAENAEKARFYEGECVDQEVNSAMLTECQLTKDGRS
jgi:hypothetical protein